MQDRIFSRAPRRKACTRASEKNYEMAEICVGVEEKYKEKTSEAGEREERKRGRMKNKVIGKSERERYKRKAGNGKKGGGGEARRGGGERNEIVSSMAGII